jgi:hypothetical protein
MDTTIPTVRPFFDMDSLFSIPNGCGTETAVKEKSRQGMKISLSVYDT